MGRGISSVNEYDRERLDTLEKSMRVLNREMGQVLGQLVWIRWLLMGVLASIIGSFFI